MRRKHEVCTGNQGLKVDCRSHASTWDIGVHREDASGESINIWIHQAQEDISVTKMRGTCNHIRFIAWFMVR